jgi:hypothetical protein
MTEKVSTKLEQLLRFRFGPIWDGNLISKAARDALVDAGLIVRSCGGFQSLTPEGCNLLVVLGYLNEETWRGWTTTE